MTEKQNFVLFGDAGTNFCKNKKKRLYIFWFKCAAKNSNLELLGNYERVVEILEGKEPSSYSPDLRIILLKTFAQLGENFFH